MQILKSALFFIFSGFTISGFSQKQEAITKYINDYKDLAVSEMIRTGVPAAITLAQGIHESGAGVSKLASMSNNHFGIKCKSNWTGETVKHDDDEKNECFRKYPSVQDSYRDHSDFLKNGSRYAFLFSIDPADYTEWANGLRKAGYATNPKYPQALIKLIEDYNLQEYTLLALNEPSKPIFTAAVVSATERENLEPLPHAKTQVDYPVGVFKLNDTKVVFVKAGTPYLTIAREYDVDFSKIFEFNEMQKKDMADKDQLVYLQRKRKTGHNDFHLVLPGETMHDIAQQEAIREESLRELNWLKEDERPAPGERLSLRLKSTTMPRLALKDNLSIVPTGSKLGQ